LQTLWKQPVVVDYKPGAGTTLGTGIVAKSPADGYTLGMAITALTINPSLQPNMTYDTKKDLVGVSQVAQAHFGLFAHPSQPFNTMPELIAYAKKNPNALSYATPGAGTGTHLAGEMLANMAGIRLLHIPYKGTALAMPDLISGKVDVLFDSLPTGLPHVKDGRLRALGVTSAQRTNMAPGLPAISEVLPGYESTTWFGLFGPPGLRPEIVARVNTAALQALADPEVKDKLQRLGIEAIGTSPMQFTTMLASESAKWKKIITERKITLD
jgi:tripartite-type tricarboxylate transporter receptor subunit TctC